MKKKQVIIIGIFVLILLLVLEDNNSNVQYNTSDTTSAETNSTSNIKATNTLDNITGEEIKYYVSNALLEQITKTFSDAVPEDTKYKINSHEIVEIGTRKIIVYGTLNLYDKYGSLTKGNYYSSNYTKKFEVTIYCEFGRYFTSLTVIK